jgi:PAS domain S-box-containing protein
LVGYDRETIIGNTPSLIKDEGDVEQAEKQLGRLLSSDGPESAVFEVTIHTREGDPVVCEDHMGVLPYEGEQFNGSVGVLRDITEYKKRRQRLKRQKDRLEEFASVVSHDLRNPLQVAHGRLRLVQEDCESEHIDDIEQALDRMDALIEDVLTLAREGNEVGEVESVVLADVVKDCWQNVSTTEAEIVTDYDRTIRADRTRLQQLLENLLGNSIEHGGEDVTVSVGTTEDGFYVADTGPGIPEGNREDVFEAGYSTNEGGTGFGLRIVNQVAEAHGWEVTVTESDTGGARFEITGVEFVDM